MKNSAHNPEDNRQIRLGDLVRLEGLEKPQGAAVAKLRIDGHAVSGDFSAMSEKLEENKEVSVNDFLKMAKGLREALDIRVDYFGDDLSLDEFIAIKNKEKNEELCRAIEGGSENGEEKKLTYLPARIAAKLSSLKKSSGLDFHGLTKVTPAAAAELIKEKARLYFGKLNEISTETAHEFGKHEGQLVLQGITKISDEVAMELATQKGELIIALLTEMSDGVARTLASRNGALVLSRATKTVAPGAMKYFGQHKGFLNFGTITALSVEEARELAKHEDTLMLIVAGGISEEVAKELAKKKGELSMAKGDMDKIAKYKVQSDEEQK